MRSDLSTIVRSIGSQQYPERPFRRNLTSSEVSRMRRYFRVFSNVVDKNGHIHIGHEYEKFIHVNDL